MVPSPAASTPDIAEPASNTERASSTCTPAGPDPSYVSPSSRGLFSYLFAWKGPSGLGSSSTVDEVAESLMDSRRIKGKTILITGGSSPVAAELCRACYKLGGAVVLACKDVAAGEAVATASREQLQPPKQQQQQPLQEGQEAPAPTQQLETSAAAGQITVMQCDLGSLAGVVDFVERFKALGLPLHVLINNACVYNSTFVLSPDGFESHFATNYLAAVLLVQLLLPLMASSAQSAGSEVRVVNVSCAAHYIAYPPSRGSLGEGAYNLAQVEGERAGLMYMPAHAFGHAKAGLVLHARELARQLHAQHLPITINAVNPGITAAGLKKYGGYGTDTWAHSLKAALAEGCKALGMLKTPRQAAATLLWAAASPQLSGVSGAYLEDCNVARPSLLASDDLAGQLLHEYAYRSLLHRLGPQVVGPYLLAQELAQQAAGGGSKAPGSAAAATETTAAAADAQAMSRG